MYKTIARVISEQDYNELISEQDHNELCNQAQCIRVEPRSKFRLNIFSGSPVTDASYEILSPFGTPQKMN